MTSSGSLPKDRMTKHIVEERGGLMDQAQKFATGDAYRVEMRDGDLEDVSEERLEIILEQVRDIDAILNDPDDVAAAGRIEPKPIEVLSRGK